MSTFINIPNCNTSVSYETLYGVVSLSNWMELGNPDSITYNSGTNELEILYKENNGLIGKATLYLSSNGINWNIILERYITNSDGIPLLDDNGSYLNLD